MFRRSVFTIWTIVVTIWCGVCMQAEWWDPNATLIWGDIPVVICALVPAAITVVIAIRIIKKESKMDYIEDWEA